MKTASSVLQNKNKHILIIITFAILFLLLIYSIITHFSISKVQKSDSIRINIAGRQRMLTQKLSKEILLYSKGALSKNKLEKTLKIFDVTLYALVNGGVVPLDLNLKERVYLPEMENNSIKDQILKVINLWIVFKSKVEIYISNKDPIAIDYVIKNNINILNEIDKAVFMMQTIAESNNQRINNILHIIYFVVFVIFIVFISIKYYQLKNADLYISHLESVLPICANCKKIREPDSEPDKQGSWTVIEQYIGERSGSRFSHGMCPECIKVIYGKEEWYKKKHVK